MGDSTVLMTSFVNSLQLNQDQLLWTPSKHHEGTPSLYFQAALPQPCHVGSASAGWKLPVAQGRISDGTCTDITLNHREHGVRNVFLSQFSSKFLSDQHLSETLSLMEMHPSTKTTLSSL